MSTKSSTDDISSATQDAHWKAGKLMAVGAVALGIALAIIYAASIIIPDLRGT